MKKINHYFPNVILSVIFVFSFIGLSLTTEAKDKLLSSSFYISSAEKHDIYLRVTNHADDYFTKSYAVSGIPAEVYMDGLDDKTIKDAVDGKIENFFDYVSGKSSKIEETEIDFSVLEKNLTDYFSEFAEENNVEVNEDFTKQLDKTIETAESEIDSFTNIYMMDYMEKAGIPQTLRKVYPIIAAAPFVFMGVLLVGLVILILLNRKNLRFVFYWISTSGICASVIILIPCIILKYSDYFSRLVMRNDYIYYAVTGLLNDFNVNIIKIQSAALGVFVALMLVYIFSSIINNKKKSLINSGISFFIYFFI